VQAANFGNYFERWVFKIENERFKDSRLNPPLARICNPCPQHHSHNFSN
jgi:hypothetical protein